MIGRVESSLDWAKIEIAMWNHSYMSISKQASIRSIQIMVTQLSQEEIICRRLQKLSDRYITLRDNINQEIYEFEKNLTFDILREKK
jgi:hypothetical protein